MSSSLNLKKELEIDFDFLKKKKSYSFLKNNSPTNKWVNWIDKQENANFLKTNSTKSIKEIEQARLKKLYGSGYSKIHELKLVKIEIASAGKIKEWAEKILPNGKTFGEVTNANTLHYKTFKPHKGGLFCERIFGPLKDFECACGIRSKPTEAESKKILEHEQTTRSFCPNCDVEYTWSVIRRYQLGYIQLVSPVSHIWFLKANPSYLSLLLDLRRSHLESIIYCTEAITLENLWKSSQNLGLDSSPATLYSIWQKLIKTDQESLIRQKNLTSKLQSFSKFYFPKEKQKLIKKRLNFLSKNPQIFTKMNSLNTSIYLKNAILSENKTKNLVVIYINYLKKIYQKIYFKILDTTEKRMKYFESTLMKNVNSNKSLLNANLSKEIFKCNNDFLLLLESFFQIYLLSFVSKHFNLQTKSLELSSLDKNKIFFSLLQNEQNQHVSFKKLLSEFLICSLAKKEWILLICKKNTLKKLNSLLNKKISQRFLISIPYQTPINKEILRKRKKKKLLNLSYKIKKTIQIQNALYYYSGTSIEKKSKKLLFFLEKNKKMNSLTSIKLTKFKKSNNFVKTKDIVYQIESQLDKIYFQKSMSVFFNEKFLSKCDLDGKTFLDLKTYFFYLKTQKLQFSQIRENLFWIQNKSFVNQKNVQQMKNASFLKKIKDNKKTSIIEKDILISFNNRKNELLKRKKEFFKQKQKSIRFKKLKYQSSLTLEKNIYNGLNYKTDQPFSMVNKLKNDCYTISYNYLWAFNSDWKSFFYYNSTSKDFEDLKFPYICQKRGELSSQEFDLNSMDFFSKISTPLTGAAMVKKLLSEYEPLELNKMVKQHQNLIPKLNRSIRQLKEKAKKKADFVKIQKLLNKRDHIIKRLKLIRKFARKNVDPTSMILSVLPVLPPDLRPILKLQNQIAASDLNRLYQRILYRNERLKKFLKDPSTNQSFEMKYAQRLLQEAVDNLIQNGKGKVKPETNSRGQPLKSLSEILKGKQGRFRQYLLGKRVDYSGRSVIVVGPKLKIFQCGLPKEMALELFLPFLIKKVLHYKIARTVVGAKNFLDSNPKFTWNLLNEIMKNQPVLLNRAPTLHRLGIQAFQPKLVEGRAILLHPLVCPAFNADFDGDQMAVHVPLTVEARAEAWTLMVSRNHLISPATGEPIILPSQDMVLGCYYLTSEKMQTQKKKLKEQKSLIEQNKNSKLFRKKCFSNFEQILNAYQLGYISLQSAVWLKWSGKTQFSSESFNMMEIRLNKYASRYCIQTKSYKQLDKTGNVLTQYVRTTPGRILMNSIAQKCMLS